MKTMLLLITYSMLILGYKMDLPDSDFDQNIGIRLIEDIDSTKRTLTLKCGTEEYFPCSNFSIATSHTVGDDKITVNFTGITKSSICKRSPGPATASISLGTLNHNIYELEINIGSSRIIGHMAVSDSSYKVTIPDQSRVRFVNPDLYRVPEHTIYGSVHYHSGTTSPLVQSFFDSLKHYGATSALFLPGDYGDFQIGGDGQIVQTKNTAYYFTQHFIYKYADSSESLERLVRHFGLQYPDLLQIRLHTTQGESFYSWVP
jgi:hypothetical protein